jgi:hypothetical protein
MQYPIGPCSSRARVFIETTEGEPTKPPDPEDKRRFKYPFDQLEIGQAFPVSFGDSLDTSLRTAATSAGKKLKKKFTVIKHKQYNVYEVARIG